MKNIRGFFLEIIEPQARLTCLLARLGAKQRASAKRADRSGLPGRKGLTVLRESFFHGKNGVTPLLLTAVF